MIEPGPQPIATGPAFAMTLNEGKLSSGTLSSSRKQTPELEGSHAACVYKVNALKSELLVVMPSLQG